MIIQAELKRKQSEYEGEPCSVDKVIELPALRFQQFSRALLADYDFTFDGIYTPGGGSGVELDASDLTNPATKNAADLVAYVTNAWQSGWGYVWGTYGQVLTPELFQYKLTQYPEGVGQYADFIRSNRLGKHTADCVGLIKG